MRPGRGRTEAGEDRGWGRKLAGVGMDKRDSIALLSRGGSRNPGEGTDF